MSLDKKEIYAEYKGVVLGKVFRHEDVMVDLRELLKDLITQFGTDNKNTINSLFRLHIGDRLLNLGEERR